MRGLDERGERGERSMDVVELFFLGVGACALEGELGLKGLNLRCLGRRVVGELAWGVFWDVVVVVSRIDGHRFRRRFLRLSC